MGGKRVVELHDFAELSDNWQDERDREVELKGASKRHRKPLTVRHKAYIKSIEDNVVTFVCGPAGSAKSALACETAARLFRSGKFKRIVIVRPLVECDEEVGFLPGDLNEKTAPYLVPLTQWLGEYFSKSEIKQLGATGELAVIPLALMRGLNFQDTIVLLDEGQNASFRQLRMLMTRLGENCRLVICGDLKQSDIKDNPKDIPLLKVIEIFGHRPRVPGVNLVFLKKEDILRSDLVRAIEERFEYEEV